MVEFETTERGFKHFEPVVTTYGHHIKVYESSAAMEPHLWLMVEQTEETAAAAHSNIPPGEETAHLNFNNVLDVIDALVDAWLNHYHGADEDELNELACRLEQAGSRARLELRKLKFGE